MTEEEFYVLSNFSAFTINWKVDIMRKILTTKVEQHEYVRRKLLQTGNRILEENSWRDGFWFWGTGPRGTGENMLGKLWMEIRENLRNSVKNS